MNLSGWNAIGTLEWILLIGTLVRILLIGTLVWILLIGTLVWILLILISKSKFEDTCLKIQLKLSLQGMTINIWSEGTGLTMKGMVGSDNVKNYQFEALLRLGRLSRRNNPIARLLIFRFFIWSSSRCIILFTWKYINVKT